MSPSIATVKIEESISALLKWKKLQNQQQHQTDNSLYLVLTLKNVVAKPLQSIPHKLPLPNPLLPLPTTCLIIPDSSKSSTKLTVEAVFKKVKAEDIAVSNVVKLARVRSLCATVDLKKKFFEDYDVFVCDERVYENLVGVLGKGFCRKKVVVPVGLRGRVRWKEEVERACGCQVLRFGSGSCCSVRVGESGMGKGEIVENVGAGIREVVEVVPKKWKGVAAIHLKFSESLAMPLYRKDEESVLEVKSKQVEKKLLRKSS